MTSPRSVLLINNRKEGVATAGTLISCCGFFALSVRFFYNGGWATGPAIFSILIATAILKGVRLGYTVGRFIFGGLGVLLTGGISSPFSYEDKLLINAPYGPILFRTIPVVALLVFLFYCLGEHARLRGLK
jgi:hypothetical protein